MTDLNCTCDLYDEHGPKLGVLPPTLQHFGGRTKFSGRAVTVKCYEDNSRLRELCKQDGTGKVLIVDAGGLTHCAILGDMLAADFADNGWHGVVIWGAIRDKLALAEIDMGVMAILTTPRKTYPKDQGQTNVTLSIAGTDVVPQDWIVADEDGCVIVPEK